MNNNTQEDLAQNQEQQQQNQNQYSKPRRKTGPCPKYGPDQAKKMVSMRLSPSALRSIKDAAEQVFRDSQADVIERIMRFLPVDFLVELNQISYEVNMKPEVILRESLDLFKAANLQNQAAASVS